MLDKLNHLYPVRYTALGLCVVAALLSLFTLIAFGQGLLALLLFGGLSVVGVRDLQQRHSAVRRNYPIIGNLRFMLEKIRPEMRQYFIENDTEATPFSRSQRSLAYARAKGETDKRPFGSQRDMHADGHEWLNHSLQPTQLASHDFRVTIGGPACTQPYEASVFNISAMSFGSLSANAIRALNQGAKLGGFYHDTGEGSISRYHREHGGDLVWEIGSGYFGCRNADGGFDEEKFRINACDPQVKMIELKLSQGAKPGQGGILPAAKVSPEIAEARGIPEGIECHSPPAHSASQPVDHAALLVDDGRIRWAGPLADLPPAAPGAEVVWVPLLFLATIGPLFFAVSAQAPLMQRWYAADPRAGDPYPLYAASNLGSFAGLIAYPLVFEPLLPIALQSAVWAGGFAVLVILVVVTSRALPTVDQTKVQDRLDDDQGEAEGGVGDAWDFH